MLAHATPVTNAWRLGGFMVECLMIGCRCLTTPPVAAEGPQCLQRALDMGVAWGGGPGRGPSVCFRGAGIESQAPFDACLAGELLFGVFHGTVHRRAHMRCSRWPPQGQPRPGGPKIAGEIVTRKSL
jgi:hypothetical protein